MTIFFDFELQYYLSLSVCVRVCFFFLEGGLHFFIHLFIDENKSRELLCSLCLVCVYVCVRACACVCVRVYACLMIPSPPLAPNNSLKKKKN